jgi:catechol-2,3-dioxygenase
VSYVTSAADLPHSGPATTFFYYADLPAAVRWYESVLGLQKIYSNDWVAILKVAGNARLGLVDATAGSQRPVVGPNKGVLLAIETAELERWLERLRIHLAVDSRTAIRVGSHGLTRQFQVRDPEGYVVEFYAWLDAAYAADLQLGAAMSEV